MNAQESAQESAAESSAEPIASAEEVAEQFGVPGRGRLLRGEIEEGAHWLSTLLGGTDSLLRCTYSEVTSADRCGSLPCHGASMP